MVVFDECDTEMTGETRPPLSSQALQDKVEDDGIGGALAAAFISTIDE